TPAFDEIVQLQQTLRQFDGNTTNTQKKLRTSRSGSRRLWRSRDIELNAALVLIPVRSNESVNMRMNVFAQLKPFLNPRNKSKSGLVIALDEAHIAESVLRGKLISQEAISNYESQIEEMLSKIINMEGCEIPPDKKRKLTEWFRFTTCIVQQLADTVGGRTDLKSKQKKLNNVIDKTIDVLKTNI
ncbi:hypothetical protein BC937DRAFT_90398, partial [Endogone sp. FLAS-F59071]